MPNDELLVKWGTTTTRSPTGKSRDEKSTETGTKDPNNELGTKDPALPLKSGTTTKSLDAAEGNGKQKKSSKSKRAPKEAPSLQTQSTSVCVMSNRTECQRKYH